MKSLISFVVLLFAALIHAISSSGDRLLVVLEDVAEKDGYSKFLGDLEGMREASLSSATKLLLSPSPIRANSLFLFLPGRGFHINYETPKSEGLSLFHLGERSYDHVLFLPTKSKGSYPFT